MFRDFHFHNRERLLIVYLTQENIVDYTLAASYASKVFVAHGRPVGPNYG
jgi:hypothetical protein